MTTTRSRLIATVLGLVALTLGLLVAPTAPALAATPKPILFYTGNGGWPASLFTSFTQATGRPKQELAALPADLSAYTCVVLALNSIPFDAAQQDALANYIKSGGRVLALGDNILYGEENGTLSALAAGLGTGLAVLPGAIDGYDSSYPVTTDIDRSPFTADLEGL